MTRPLHDLDLLTVTQTLGKLISPPQDPGQPLFSLSLRLKNWDWVCNQTIHWLLAEDDAGRRFPDAEVPDLTGSYQLHSEAQLQTSATALLAFLQKHCGS